MKNKQNNLNVCATYRSIKNKLTRVVGLTIYYNNKNERDYAASQVNKFPHYIDHSKSNHNFSGKKEFWLSVYLDENSEIDWKLIK